MSNDHDGVTDDGRDAAGSAAAGEPADTAGPGDAARSAADRSGASDVTEPAEQASADTEQDADPDAEPTAAGESTAEPDAPAARTGSGRVAAGSARAAARRSAARAGVSETKGTPTPARAATATEGRPNIFARIGRFLREVVAELRKVIWPTRNQMVTYTIVVIIFVSFMVALVAGLDVLFARAVLAIFG